MKGRGKAGMGIDLASFPDIFSYIADNRIFVPEFILYNKINEPYISRFKKETWLQKKLRWTNNFFGDCSGSIK